MNDAAAVARPMTWFTLSPHSPLRLQSVMVAARLRVGRTERQRDKVTSGPTSSAFHFLFLLRKGESLFLSLSHWTFPSWLLPSRADCLKRSRRTSSRIRQMATTRWEWEERRRGLALPSPKIKCETAPSAVKQFDTHGVVGSNAAPGPDDIYFALLINIDHFCVSRSEGIGEKPS